MRGIAGRAYLLPNDPSAAQLARHMITLHRLRDELPWGFDTVVDIDVEPDVQCTMVRALLLATTTNSGTEPPKATHRMEYWVAVAEPEPEDGALSTGSFITTARMFIESISPTDGRPPVVNIPTESYDIGDQRLPIPGFPSDWWGMVRRSAETLMFACVAFPQLIRFVP